MSSRDFSRISLLFTKESLMDATGAMIRRIGLESYGNTCIGGFSDSESLVKKPLKVLTSVHLIQQLL